MAFTVTPVIAVSSATDLVKPTMPCLAATGRLATLVVLVRRELLRGCAAQRPPVAILSVWVASDAAAVSLVT